VKVVKVRGPRHVRAGDQITPSILRKKTKPENPKPENPKKPKPRKTYPKNSDGQVHPTDGMRVLVPGRGV
jgi:hypothetical protein